MPPKKAVSLDDRFSLSSLLEDDKSKYFFAQNRLDSFKKFCFDSRPGAVCTSQKLAAAGFFFTGNKEDPSAATCAFCLKEMIFDEEDDPWQEHVSHCGECAFVKVAKVKDDDLTMEDTLRLIAYRKGKLDTGAAMNVMANNLIPSLAHLKKMIEPYEDES